MDPFSELDDREALGSRRRSCGADHGGVGIVSSTATGDGGWELRMTDESEASLEKLDCSNRVNKNLREICECPYRIPIDYGFDRMPGPRNGRLETGRCLRLAVDIDVGLAAQSLTVYAVFNRENDY
jgi:hypothetical protein